MKKQKGNIEGSGQEVLSIPQVLLDAAGIDRNHSRCLVNCTGGTVETSQPAISKAVL